jgi:hypothetical protein
VRRLAAAAVLALALVPAARAEDGLAVRAAATPRSHLFGDPVTAEIEVVVPPSAAASVTLAPDFRPYARVGPVTVTRSGDENRAELHYRYSLDCLERDCLPGDARRQFIFAPTQVRARIAGRQLEVTARWPVLMARSRLAPADVAREELRSSVFPVGSISYRVGPDLLFWTLVGAAAALALGGAAVLAALVFGLRLPWRRDRFRRLGPIERALVLVRAAASAGDASRRRRALERLGHELEQRGRIELGEEACRLAWAEATPDSQSLLVLAGRIETALREAP